MKWLKGKSYYILAFIAPILICVLLGLIFGLFNFNTLLISDMKAQYVPLFTYLKNSISSDSSILYSMSNGLGSNMIGTYAYYLTNPLNLLVCLFSKEKIYIFLEILIALKISLSCLTSFCFFKHSFKIDKKDWLFLIASISYGFCAFSIGYYFHIMWLDSIVFLPLILIGIDKIFNGEKSTFYFLSLSLAIFCNYYMGFMLCIFSLLYFVYKLLLCILVDKKEKKEYLSFIIEFIIASLLSAGVVLILLIPTYMELLLTSKTSGISIFNNSIFHLDIYNYLKGFVIGISDSSILNEKYPLLYFSIFFQFLSISYFFNSKICKIEKILSFVIQLVFIISFLWDPINMIWHGFSNPQCFNYRYSFIFVLFSIYLSVKSFINIKGLNIKKFLLILICFLAMYLYIMIYNIEIYKNIWYSLGVILLYFFIILFYCDDRYNYKIKTIKVLIIMLVISEMFFSSYFIINDYLFNIVTIEEQEETYKIFNKEIGQFSDNSFYRIDNNIEGHYLDTFLYNYSGISTFNSMVHKNIIDFTANVGFKALTNNVVHDGKSTTFLDSILGIKYLILKKDYNQYFNYELISSFEYSNLTGIYYNVLKDNIDIYKNNQALSLGFMVPDKVKKIYDDKRTSYSFIMNDDSENVLVDRLWYQNIMAQSMALKNCELFKPIEYDYNSNDHTYVFNVDNLNNIYFTVSKALVNSNEKVNVYINGVLNYILEIDDNYIIFVENNYELGEQVNIKIEAENYIDNLEDAYLYYYNDDEFNNLYNELSQNQMAVLENKNNYIKGKVTATKDKPVLFTSIPYEPGWTIYVDGKESKQITLYDTFIGLNLSEGEHTIEFKFYPPGLKVGIICSIISLILAIIYFIKENIINEFIVKIFIKYKKIMSYLFFGVLTTIVNILIYSLFCNLLKCNYMFSSFVAWTLSVLFAYVTNRRYVFDSKSKDFKTITDEIYEFFKFRFISLIIDLIFMYMLVSIMALNDMLAKILVNILVIILNYIFSKMFIFKEVNK